MRLDQRLSLIASFVRKGSRVADIGTDHAHLPVWLVREGISPCAVATDIRSGPADRAAFNVRNAGLASRISVRLGDGLAPVTPDEVDDIIIAGMGGETIAGILDSAPWTKDSRFQLIVQPMTKADFLHQYLLTNGFFIKEERIAEDGTRLYPVLAAVFDPQEAAVQAERPAAYLVGGLDLQRNSVYIEKQIKRLLKTARALRQAGRTEEAEKEEALAGELSSAITNSIS